MARLLTGIVAVSLMTGPAIGGTTITPLQGSIGDPFTNGAAHGWGWNGVESNLAGHMIGNLYDNIMTWNGGAATPGFCGPFRSCPVTQAFMDWANATAQWGDDMHGLAGPSHGGPTAVITSIRYGYMNSVATATHTIHIYDMVPPSAGHPPNANANAQFDARLLTLVVTGVPAGTAMVTVTGLSVHAGVAAWIKFGEAGPGFPGTFWLTGGTGNGVGTSHYGLVYDRKSYYGPGQPLHYFYYVPYFDGPVDGYYVPANIQVALSGFVLPAPATIGLLGLAGLSCLQRRRDVRRRSSSPVCRGGHAS